MRKWLLLLLMLFVALPSMAQEATPETTDDNVYTNDLYTFPVPTNWEVEEQGDIVYLYSSEERIQIYNLVLEEQDDMEAVINEAWQMVRPDFDAAVEQTMEITDEAQLNGFEFGFNVFYVTDDDRLLTGSASIFEGLAYISLIDAEIVALQERIAQLQIFATGFRARAMEPEAEITEDALAITDEMIAELESFITEILELSDIPGLSVAIVQGDEVIYSNGFGVTEMGSDEAVTAETRMMVASTTKAMTTMAMAAQVDNGAFTWDTPVIEVLPQFAVADPELSESITIRNLMCACSGVPRRDFELIFNQAELTAEDVVEQLESFRFFTDFGEAFQYSNQMVATGGYAATAASGVEYGNLLEGYYSLMQDFIFDPIGMPATTFSFDEVTSAGNYAQPHGLNLDGELNPIPLTQEEFGRAIAPAGGAWSNVLDMAEFAITAMNGGTTPGGTQVVSEENLLTTWEPQVAITADMDYGLGWFLSDYNGRQVIGHDGNMLGFTSQLAFLPDDGIGVVVLTNARLTNSINEAIFTRLLELVFDQEPQIEEQILSNLREDEADDESEATGDVQNQGVEYTEIDTEAVSPYSGQWTNADLGMIEITLEDETLTMDVGEWTTEIRAYLNDDDEFEGYITYNSPLPGVGVEFTENEDGEMTIVFGSGVVEYTFTAVE